MKRSKNQKGITLIALIITIVVLLILAAVAIAAIQNENILSHANNAAVKYNGSVTSEQGILGGYLDVLDKYNGNEWITIYEGNATTEGGSVVLGEEDLFVYGAAGAKYRITVQSDEFSGPPVEILPILMNSTSTMSIYALFAIINGEAIGFTSTDDANEKLNALGENDIAVAGMYQTSTDGATCGIMLDSPYDVTCEYTITKIERTEVDTDLAFMMKYVTGKNATEFLNKETYVFIDDPETADVDESTAVTYLNMAATSITEAYFYAKYNNKAYRIVVDASYNTKMVQVFYIPQGREGDVIEGGTYDGWIILTDRDGLVEIVSPDVAKDEEGNALTLTLGYGDTSVTVTEDKNADGTIGDNFDIAWLSQQNARTKINNYCDEIVTATNNEGVRSVGEQYEMDLVKMSYFGKAETGISYWLSKTATFIPTNSILFASCAMVNQSGVFEMATLYDMRHSDRWYYNAYNFEYGVRPVVINPSGI